MRRSRPASTSRWCPPEPTRELEHRGAGRPPHGGDRPFAVPTHAVRGWTMSVAPSGGRVPVSAGFLAVGWTGIGLRSHVVRRPGTNLERTTLRSRSRSSAGGDDGLGRENCPIFPSAVHKSCGRPARRRHGFAPAIPRSVPKPDCGRPGGGPLCEVRRPPPTRVPYWQAPRHAERHVCSFFVSGLRFTPTCSARHVSIGVHSVCPRPLSSTS